jgi:uncharacterized protein (TIGR02145 family)
VIWSGSNILTDNNFEQNSDGITNVFWWGSKTPNPSGNSEGNNGTGVSSDADWPLENQPCPSGWRLPTKGELERLLELDMRTIISPVRGIEIYDSKKYPDEDSSKLFLPTAGWVSGKNGHAYEVNVGYYWSSTRSGSSAYVLIFTPGNTVGSTPTAQVVLRAHDGKNPDAMSVRCVRAKDDI